jgi:acyl homoserine lactone synthase
MPTREVFPVLTYIYANDLSRFPKLQSRMFCDRADQFKRRLNWDVSVDARGFEMDEYDAINPLYVIWKTADGGHGGSMRVLPTTGPCLTNDHFSAIAGGTITSPLIWESTRFCLSPTAGQESARISAALMLAGCEIGLRFGLKHAVGVFDPRMVRIYRTLGWAPEVLGSHGVGRSKICVGLWEFSDATRALLAQKAGVSTEQSADWFQQSFCAPEMAVEVA